MTFFSSFSVLNISSCLIPPSPIAKFWPWEDESKERKKCKWTVISTSGRKVKDKKKSKKNHFNDINDTDLLSNLLVFLPCSILRQVATSPFWQSSKSSSKWYQWLTLTSVPANIYSFIHFVHSFLLILLCELLSITAVTVIMNVRLA